MMQMATRRARFHQELLFPHPEELNCSSKSLLETFLHPHDASPMLSLYFIGKSELTCS